MPEHAPEEKLNKDQQSLPIIGLSVRGLVEFLLKSGDIDNRHGGGLDPEALQEGKISSIAEQIAADKGKKFVMIAGPSSSGKTTFSHRLSVQLKAHGMKPHPIAVDNYFVNREDTPLDKD